MMKNYESHQEATDAMWGDAGADPEVRRWATSCAVRMLSEEVASLRQQVDDLRTHVDYLDVTDR